MIWVFLDLETRSRCDLPRRGGHVYAEDPSTSLLCGAALIYDDQTGASRVNVWTPYDIKPGWKVPDEDITKLGLDPGSIEWPRPYSGRRADRFGGLLADLITQDCVTLVAHNAEGFDRPVMEAWGFPPYACWLDTAHCARRSGLPAALDVVGKELFGLGKDSKGQKVLKLLMKPHAKTGDFIEPNGGQIALLARYCVRDVLLMASAWLHEGWGDPHPDDEVRLTHCAIDRRGVPIDLALASRLWEESVAIREGWVERAGKFGLDETALRSSVEFPKWLEARGFSVEDAQKGTIERVLAVLDAEGHPNEEAIRTACEARLAFNRVTEGKAAAALDKTCSTGRMHGTLVYWGAHTGRWAGRGLQLQNLPSPAEGFSEAAYDAESTAAYAAEIGADPSDVLSSMLRGLVTAEPGRVLLMIDYRQIEARVLPWLAGQEETLQAFRDGQEIYKATAASMFKIPYEKIEKSSLERLVGKVATLALGYAGGPGALLTTARNSGIEIESVETMEGPDGKAITLDCSFSGLVASDVVLMWRNANRGIAGDPKKPWRTPEGRIVIPREGGLWNAYEDAAKSIAARTTDGGEIEVGRCLFERWHDHLRITLPSGRPLIYRHPRYIPWPDMWGGAPKTVVFRGVYKGVAVDESTYGGKLAENLTQAVARDVMAEAMIRLEREALPCLMSVHDEVVISAEDPCDLERAETIMKQSPEWAKDLPLDVAGEVGARFRK